MTDVPSDIGTVVPGGYRLSRLVAEDALGAWFAARDPASHKQVSVLLVPSAVLARDPDGFDQGCALAARVQHENVVPVIAHGRLGDRGYRITPWTGTSTMQGALSEPLLVSTAVGWARDLAQGLQAAHAVGLVHGGLSPAVVRLARRQEPPDQARIDGFGLAPLLRAGTSTSGLGSPLASAAWACPEHALGAPLDARSDLYALGALLFHALTGRPPFIGPSIKVLSAHVHDPPPVPSSLTTGIPSWLDELVLALLAKDPARRPASAAEVAARLQEGASLLGDSAAHPERVTATVAPVRLPNAEVRGAASRRTPRRLAREVIAPRAASLRPVIAALALVLAILLLAWWLFGVSP